MISSGVKTRRPKLKRPSLARSPLRSPKTLEVFLAPLVYFSQYVLKPDVDADKYNDAPADFWDDFYRAKKDSFFKDRAWLKNEFEPLAAAVAPSVSPSAPSGIPISADAKSSTDRSE